MVNPWFLGVLTYNDCIMPDITLHFLLSMAQRQNCWLMLSYKYTRVYTGYMSLVSSVWSRIKFMRQWHTYSLPLVVLSSKHIDASFLLSCVCIVVVRCSWSHMLSTDVILQIFFHVITFIMQELTTSLYSPREIILAVWMWKFIWLCTISCSAKSSYAFVEKEKSMTFLKYVM